MIIIKRNKEKNKTKTEEKDMNTPNKNNTLTTHIW